MNIKLNHKQLRNTYIKDLSPLRYDKSILNAFLSDKLNIEMVYDWYCCTKGKKRCWVDYCQEGISDLTKDDMRNMLKDEFYTIKRYLYPKKGDLHRIYYKNTQKYTEIRVYLQDIYDYNLTIYFTQGEIE